MVQVPYKDSARLRVPNQTQEAQVNTAAGFGAQVGQSLNSVAQGGIDVAQAMDARDQIRAKADSDAAFNEYMHARRSILRDPETGYLNQEGENALGKRETLAQRLQSARSTVEKGMSPRALKAFKDRADALDQQAAESAIIHESSQLKAYSTAASNAAISAALEEAGLFYDDTRASDKFLGEALAETRAQAAREGWPKEQLDLRLATLTSEVTVNRAIRLAETNPAAVDDFLTQNADRMLPNAAHDLRVKLKPIINDAKARAIVDPMLAGMSGGEDSLGVPTWLAAAESGNNSNAANPMSSARGRVQFIDGTYLQYVDRVVQNGGAQWAVGLTREEILATRSDPQKEAEIYRAFRQDNQNMLTGAGYAVSPRNEYIMHHLGGGGGLALLDAEKYNPGQTMRAFLTSAHGAKKADEMIAANPWMQGKTVRSALNWFERKAGGNRAVANPADAYRQAMQIEDPDVRERAVAMIDQRMAVSEKADAYEREQAMDGAYQAIVTQGIMPEQLPIEQQLLLGPSGMSTMMAAAQAYATGSDIHNEDHYLNLWDMANSTDPSARQEFLDMDLNESAADLSQSALLGLKKMQVEMRGLAEERKNASPGDLIYDVEDFPKVYNTVKDQYQAATGYRPGQASNSREESERWVNFTSQLKAAMVDYANQNGAPMPQSLIDQTVGMLLTPAIINPRGPINEREVNLFDAPFREQGATVDVNVQVEQIPLAERERLTQTLAHAYNRPPTEDEIVDLYERELLLRNGLLPDMEYGDIPKDLRRELERVYPNASEEQRLDKFLEVTTRRIQSLSE